MKKILKTFSRAIGCVFGLAALAWVASEVAVGLAARGRTYDRLGDVPKREFGLVLGTSKFVAPGRPNLHYQYRIEAAAQLFNAGKVERLIVSGNGATANYNEPRMMREDLVARGVPSNRIIADDAGFRTFDSVARAAAVFHAPDCTVISQVSHNERAIFIGWARGDNLIGWNARPVSFFIDPRTAIRERLARVLAVLDVVFLNRKSAGPSDGNALSSESETR